MTTHDRFGGLRALLQKTPSEGVWEALREELALWDDGERDRVALPYASAHLDRWPAVVQRHPAWRQDERAWEERLVNVLGAADPARLTARAQDKAWAARCHHLTVETSEGAEALRPHLTNLRQLVTLRVTGYKLDGELLGALMRHAWPPSLRELSVDGLSYIHKDTRRQIIEAMAQNEALEGIETLRLHYNSLSGARLGALLSAPLARRLRALHISDEIDAACARALLELPALERLETLALHACKLDAASARVLAQSPLLTTLKRLDVSHNRLDEGLAALLDSPHTRALTALETTTISLSPAGARALRGVTWPPGLETLDLHRCHLSGHTTEALADAPIVRLMRRFAWAGRRADQPTRLMQSPHLTGLRELSLRHGDDALLAATRNPALRDLGSLDLYVQRMEPALGEALRQSVFSDALRSLQLSTRRGPIQGVFAPGAWRGLRRLVLCGRAGYSPPTAGDSALCPDVEIEALAQSRALEGLEELDVQRNLLTDAAAMALAESGRLGALRTLDLSHNRIGPRGVRALMERGELGALESLNLSYNPIGDEGAALLATDKIAPRVFCALAERGLAWASIGLAGARALLRSPHIGQVAQLHIADHAFTAADLAQLAQDPALANLRGELRLQIPRGDEADWLPLLRSPYTNQPTRDHVQQIIDTWRSYAAHEARAAQQAQT